MVLKHLRFVKHAIINAVGWISSCSFKSVIFTPCLLQQVGHPSGLFYNGLTADVIQSTSANNETATHPGGIHHIAYHGISARAILLDYHTWSQTTQASGIDPFSQDSISLDPLMACGKYQGLNMTPSSSGGDVQPGDILLIRIGFTAKFRSTSISDWSRFAKRDNREQYWAGLDGSSDELKAWIHDCYFSAVVSDAPALESWPPADMNKCLHTVMLPLWGCIIGEFFDLERLSERCRQEQRWKVFFVSSPPSKSWRLKSFLLFEAGLSSPLLTKHRCKRWRRSMG